MDCALTSGLCLRLTLLRVAPLARRNIQYITASECGEWLCRSVIPHRNIQYITASALFKRVASALKWPEGRCG